MSEPRRKLKPGWRWVKFGDVVRQTKEVVDPETSGLERYVAGEHMDTDDLRIRRWGTIGDGYLGPAFHRRFRAGQVLFGSRRTYLRKVAVADFDGVCANTTFVLEPKNGQLLPELLPFIMQTEGFVEHSVKQSRGSVNPYVNFSDLEWFEFALPVPEVQRRLGAVLRAAEDVFGTIRDATGSWRRVLGARRNEIFEKIVARGELCSLQEVTLASAYGPRFPAEQYQEHSMIRTIRTTDMPDFGVITLNTAPGADVPVELVAEHRLIPGDFLISRTGFTSGRAAVFRGSPDGDVKCKYIPAAFLIRLRFDPDRFCPEILLEYLQTPRGDQLIRQLQRGTQQLNISASALLRERVPAPKIDDQRAIVAELQALRDNEECFKKRLINSKQIELRLAEACFRGE